MEKYTLLTNEEDLQLGRISVKEKLLFDKYVKIRDEADRISTELHNYLKKQYSNRIAEGNLEQIKVIREELRWVPDSVAKTLMFREILMREDEIIIKF